MNRRKKLIIAILVVILIGLLIIIAGSLFFTSNSELATGNKTILVCAIDESEERPGMGACDMAFLVSLENGSIVNYTAVYPGGMYHPTASEPQEAQAQGAGSRLLLHDSFWDADNSKGMQLAKEIVEYNTNITIDNVVAVNSEALDAILAAASPVEVNGTQMNVSGIDFIREQDWGNGVSRGDAVLEIVKAVAKSAKDPVKKSGMVNAALDQYSKGNIVMDEQSAFVSLLASKGVETLFG
ncbi:DUF4012 domain-containing protein [Methanobrevibacter oralis]|uniref:Cell envelope-related transcriptional attenuator domain protein n=1 Tax=Methanobrevibacter oralis TaxID=66851 RepID=A0A162FI60_METOA|nr:DUF4012 domain-containing protein [Methanobrevibacter oralis]KZX13395.1 hypothetical protein MBORA_06230 [Methanobrevibacter oralis]